MFDADGEDVEDADDAEVDEGDKPIETEDVIEDT